MREIIDRCTNLQEETVNSVENWTDIIPEAEVKTEIGEISKLQAEMVEKEAEITALKKKEAISTEEERNRINEIKKLTEDVKKYIREIKEKEKKIDINVPSSGVGYTSEDIFSDVAKLWSFHLKGECKKCGSPYHYVTSKPTDHDPGLCPKCQAAGLDENDNKK